MIENTTRNILGQPLVTEAQCKKRIEQARTEGYQRGVEEGIEDALGGKAAKHYQEALKIQGAAGEQERCAEIAENIAKRYESSANARGRTMVYEDGMGYVAVAHEIQDAIRNTEEGS